MIVFFIFIVVFFQKQFKLYKKKPSTLNWKHSFYKSSFQRPSNLTDTRAVEKLSIQLGKLTLKDWNLIFFSTK